MFAALPAVKGAPLIMPIEYYRQISRRLWDLGARPTEQPLLEYVPPSGTEPNWLTSPGRWVPAGQGPARTERDEAREAIDRMTAQQKAELLKALQSGDGVADSPAGRVVGTLTAQQREVVLAVLREEQHA